MNNTTQHIEIYDTTLRDGTQGAGVSFSLMDKLKIARELDALGVDYIEGGYPLSNPKDQSFFEQAAEIDFRKARICAFGMTRRRDLPAEKDAGMKALVDCNAPVITIVGKTWDLHVEQVLSATLEQNIDMIRDSIAYCANTAGPKGNTAEVFYDAEHFFDGYRANADYAIATLRAAIEGGATRLILCDTNGGSMPEFVQQVVTDVRSQLGENVKLGIHTHNDSGLAVANSLAAVHAGAMQVQGTINGIGERCGNVDLITVIANAQLKMNIDCLDGESSLKRLTETSRLIYELANMNLNDAQPYVGTSAFAHKGGMHVHAVNRIAHSYEHIPPQSVGNVRQVLVSELSGVSNIAATLGEKYKINKDRETLRRVLLRVQDLENAGYQFEAAGASLDLLIREELGLRKQFWALDHFRCVILKAVNGIHTTEAIVKMAVGDSLEHQVSEGDGPVDALNRGLRKCLEHHYPDLGHVHLRDYKVRVVNAQAETAAKVRVIMDFSVTDSQRRPVGHFSTIGVSENIVDASWQAITEALEYHLLESEATSLQHASTQ